VRNRILRSLGLAGALLAAATAAGAQQPHVDPLLRALLRPEIRAETEQALRDALPVPDRAARPGGLALDADGPTGEARVGVFVLLRTPGALAELRAAGAEVGVVAGDVATARVPLSALPALLAARGIERVEGAQVVQRTNDLATAAIRADRVRNLVGDAWQGWTGQGVIVGVYDSGIDFRHPDFRDAAGNTRLSGLWDQTLAGTPPTGFAFGVFCGVPSLNDGTCPQRDNDGHGTHVAGSAAGDGSAAAPQARYAGVAPAANLLAVKGGDRSFREDWIIEGIDWVFREATRLGQAAVVNLSLGGHFGPHDGTRLYERAIDNLSGPGRIVVAAAGNEGANPVAAGQPRLIHATAVPVAGTTQSFIMTVPQYNPAPGARDNHIRITFWYGGADRLRIAVVRPDGTRHTVEPGQLQQSNSPSGGIYIDNASTGPDPQNGDNHAIILIENLTGSGPPASGVWTLEVTPLALPTARRYHFWIYGNSVGAAGVAPGFTNSHLVGSPATSRRAVSVGAFVTRTQWTSTDGNTYGFGPAANQEAIGDIAQFSSVGPTRDGRLKPEITAPGKVIISTLSRDATVPTALIVPGQQHMALQGTSMAAPMVTGGIALLLQRAPSLTPEEIKQVFSATSIRDEFTQRSYSTGDPGGVPNFTWGWGKLNVEASVAAAAEFARTSVLGVSIEPIQLTAAPLARRGERVPLLAVTLAADGPEALDVTQLGFAATGTDPGARLLLIRDLDGDGQIGPQDPVLGTVEAALAPGDTARATFSLGLRVPAGQSVQLLLALEFGGGAPHRAPLRAWFVPADTRARGAESGQPSPLRQPTSLVPSGEIRPTLLLPGEVIALSENPVRSDRLIINFRGPPRRAEIYTVSGRKVVDLITRLENNARITWDLTNDQGVPVAPGVYLAIFEVGQETVRERLIITRPGGGRE
jgi:subtilisin family serine protease